MKSDPKSGYYSLGFRAGQEDRKRKEQSRKTWANQHGTEPVLTFWPEERERHRQRASQSLQLSGQNLIDFNKGYTDGFGPVQPIKARE